MDQLFIFLCGAWFKINWSIFFKNLQRSSYPTIWEIFFTFSKSATHRKLHEFMFFSIKYIMSKIEIFSKIFSSDAIFWFFSSGTDFVSNLLKNCRNFPVWCSYLNQILKIFLLSIYTCEFYFYFHFVSWKLFSVINVFIIMIIVHKFGTTLFITTAQKVGK